MRSIRMSVITGFLVVVLAVAAFGVSMVAASNVPAGYSQLAQTTTTVCSTEASYVRTRVEDPTEADTNFGSSIYLRLDGGASAPPTTDTERDYIKFDLSGLPVGATITSAVLTMHVYPTGTDGTQQPIGLYSTSTSWAENTITWNNQPGLGGLLNTNPGPIAAGAAPTWSAGALGAPGVYAFALAFTNEGTHSDGIDFYSDDTANPPCLEVTYTEALPPTATEIGGPTATGPAPATAVPKPGPDMVNIPDWAVVGRTVAWTPVYYMPVVGAASDVDLAPGTALWIFGVDESGQFYLGELAGKFFWLPLNVVGPNYDEVWNGHPLPTQVVQGDEFKID